MPPRPPAPHPTARRSVARRAARAAAQALAILALGCAVPAARAQTLRLSSVFGQTWGATATGPAPSFGVAVAGARVEGTTVTLGLRYAAAGGTAQLDLGLSANDTFGPLGNVIGEGTGSLRTDGSAQGSIGARGVLGPVALGVRLLAFGADPAHFDPLAAARDDRPAFGSSGWGVALTAAGRPTRSLVLEAAPEIYLVPAGGAARLSARLRWLRALGPHELSLRARAFISAGWSPADAALGVGLTYRRPREPDLDAALYLGLGPDGWRPGATAALAQPLAGGARLQLEASLEPYRVDVAPYRATAGASVPLAGGTGRLTAVLAAGRGAASAAVEASLELPLGLR